MYQCIPACPGHSEDHGRTINHLFWEISSLDTESKLIFDERIRTLCNFPAIIFNGKSQQRSLSKLIVNGTNMTASELKSIRWIIVYALLDLIDPQHQDVWLEHVEHAAGYDIKSWNIAEIFYWTKMQESYLSKMKKLYCEHSNFTNPKAHDPIHDLDYLNLFGSFKNLDEMSFESLHQQYKHYVEHSNKQKLHKTLMKMVMQYHFDYLFAGA